MLNNPPNIEKKILCADKSVFIDLKELLNSWYYCLIAYMSYSNPTFSISDIHLLLASDVKKIPF